MRAASTQDGAPIKVSAKAREEASAKSSFTRIRDDG